MGVAHRCASRPLRSEKWYRRTLVQVRCLGRKFFIQLIGSAALVRPRLSAAQSSTKPVVGILMWSAPVYLRIAIIEIDGRANAATQNLSPRRPSCPRARRSEAAAKAELEGTAAQSRRTGKPARRFKDFRWMTRSSWSRQRRVVAKAEWTKDSAAGRFRLRARGADGLVRGQRRALSIRTGENTAGAASSKVTG